MGVNSARWFCAQIGAREHYAIPQVLHRHGKLAALYTDFWAGPITHKLALGTGTAIGRSLATRCHPELADVPVVAWNIHSLLGELGSQRQLKREPAIGPHHVFIKNGQSFAIRVREKLKRRSDLDSKSVFFGYDTGALETLEWCREQKIRCLVNQMDPGRVESELVQEEELRWPDWKIPGAQVPEAYFQRREQEWAQADHVIVNSGFSCEALVKQGVPREKIVVIPLCYESSSGAPVTVKNRKAGEPLRVLFLGQVILRKGIQYLWRAAKELEKTNIRFDIVGSVGISASAIKSAPKNMIFHGRATRDQTADWYRRSDLFVLPTLSDGFAITQLEAMTYGLPVVTTPCCGEVVTDGADGFIVPPREVSALVQVFQRYLREPELLNAQQSAALVKSRQFTLERLAENLTRLEASLNKVAL